MIRKKLNYLKQLKIDLKKIKRMTINIEDEKDKKNKNFFETLFSFNNIENNLIYLNICFKKNNNINHELFEKINNLKFLKYLYK